MNSVMTPRLLSICSLVPEGAAVIDVGSDHAYVPIYLVKNRKAVCALATDVHDGPVKRSRENIEKQGLGTQIKTQKADGLFCVDTASYDTIIIAGMGGKLIARILENCDNLSGKTLILQPMTAATELRAFLLQNGFSILTEKLALEDEKLYAVMLAERGNPSPYTEMELLLGKGMKEDPLYPLLLRKTYAKLQKRLQGLEKAKNPSEIQISRLKAIAGEIEELYIQTAKDIIL